MLFPLRGFLVVEIGCPKVGFFDNKWWMDGGGAGE